MLALLALVLAVLALAYLGAAIVVFGVLLERDTMLVAVRWAVVWPLWLAVTPVVKERG